VFGVPNEARNCGLITAGPTGLCSAKEADPGREMRGKKNLGGKKKFAGKKKEKNGGNPQAFV
jgi:hypothetical protein